jgi:hypothetical protein
VPAALYTSLLEQIRELNQEILLDELQYRDLVKAILSLRDHDKEAFDYVETKFGRQIR